MEHEKQFIFLKNKFESEQLAHAYVFSGSRDANLPFFAKEFVKFIHCSQGSKPCQKCQSCLAIEKNQYPDVLVVRSENSKSSKKEGEDKQEIDVALIRDAQHFLSYKSYYGSYKVVIIEDAERMNREAQNCFLKNLEEPKGKTLMLMLSSRPETLLPTISSRCQHIKFSLVGTSVFSAEEQNVLQGLLNVIHLDLAEKFLYVKNADLNNRNFSTLLRVLEKYFRQLLLLKIGAVSAANVPVAPESANKYSVYKIKNIIRRIENISYTSMMYNASPKLALEIVLLEI